jgi:2-amino-4-hydroxy-6-hydroxymethyldihydropteridine diphosphokinase
MKLNRVYIGIGSNIAAEENLTAGIQLMREWMNVLQISPVYESIPVGGAETDPRYLNVVIYVETYTYLDLLRKRLRGLEYKMGRVRGTNEGEKPKAVTLDLDVLLFNNEVDRSVVEPLPHPDIMNYAHASIPLADLAPDMQHPVTGETLDTIAKRFRDTPGFKRREDVVIA